jgi:hypothetical protein
MSDSFDVEGYLRRAAPAAPSAKFERRIRLALSPEARRERPESGPRRRRPPGWALTAIAVAAFFALIVWVVVRPARPSAHEQGTPAAPQDAEKTHQAALKALVDELGSDDPELREKASARLQSLGEPALEALDSAAASAKDLELRLRAKKVAKAIRRRLKLESMTPEDVKKRTDCATQLSKLWMLQTVYMSQFGGKMKRMPSETGPAFWLKLTSVVPPLIDNTQMDVLVCPLSKEKSRPGFTTFRGPKIDVARLRGDEPVGACEPGLHPDGTINVLLKNGEIRTVDSDDELYKRALENTTGATKPEEKK